MEEEMIMMGNLGQGIEDRALARGLERGRQEGMELGRREGGKAWSVAEPKERPSAG